MLKKGPTLALVDKLATMASKPERRRLKRGGEKKKGDRVLREIANLGRVAVGGAPRGAYKPKRPEAGESFSHAMSSPFSLEARGARVPDLYSFPTNTFRLQTSMLMGASQTEFGACFFPNPYFTAFDTGQAALTIANVTSTGGCRRFASANSFMGLTTPDLFVPLATAYRVVGGGIKIRNLLPELTATGRVYIACVPVASNGVPNYNFLESQNPATTAYYNEILDRMGVPRLQVMRSASLQMEPVAKDFTIGQLVGDEELEVDFGIYHPDFFRFKPTSAKSTAFSSVLSEYDDVGVNATGVVVPNVSGSKSGMQIDGGSAIIVWFEGVPSTAAAPIEVDICLHLECVPVIAALGTTTNQGITPESDNPPRPVHGSTAMVEHEISRQRTNPDSIIRLHRNSKGAGGARIAEID